MLHEVHLQTAVLASSVSPRLCSDGSGRNRHKALDIDSVITSCTLFHVKHLAGALAARFTVLHVVRWFTGTMMSPPYSSLCTYSTCGLLQPV